MTGLHDSLRGRLKRAMKTDKRYKPSRETDGAVQQITVAEIQLRATP